MKNNKTRKKRMSNGMKWAMKRPWRITYRNTAKKRTVQIVKNGEEKDKLLKKLDEQGLRIYGINNLTDKQIEYYKNNGFL
jgi:hypothetical protein